MKLFLAVVVVTIICAVAWAEETCKNVSGRITSDVVSEGCPEPAARFLCTRGHVRGSLNADFFFVADLSLGMPFPNGPNNMGPPLAVVGVNTLTLNNANLCAAGTELVVDDTSAFTPGATGYFGGVQTVRPMEEGCVITSGTITSSGIFEGGCTDCVYAGVICFEE